MSFSSQNLSSSEVIFFFGLHSRTEMGQRHECQDLDFPGYYKELLKNMLPCEKQTLMQMSLEKLGSSLWGLLQKIFLIWVRSILDNCRGPSESNEYKIDPIFLCFNHWYINLRNESSPK